MKPSSPLESLLKVCAAALAFAIVGLGFVWLRGDPAPPPIDVTAEVAHDEPADTMTAETAGREDRPAPAPVVGTASEAAAPAVATSAVLYGTVQNADGEPVDGWMWLNRGAEQVGASGQRSGGRAFAFAGLSPGTYRLTARFEDQLPVLRDVEVEAPRTRLDITLDPAWRLTVHAVTPDGAPLTEAVGKAAPRLSVSRDIGAIATLQPLAGDLPPASRGPGSAGIGVFRGGDPFRDKVMAKTAVGVLTLPPGEPVHVALMLGNTLLAQRPAAPGEEELTFTLAPEALLGKLAKVRLRVVDETGSPMPDVRVNLDGSFNPKSLTDADGRIEFTNVQPGRRRCSIYAKDLYGPPLEIDLPAGADVDAGDIALRAPVKFDVSFDGFGGSGGIYFYLLDPPPRPGLQFDDAYHSADNGNKQSVALFPGRYAAFARGRNGVTVRTFDTTSVAGQVMTLELARGASLRFTADLELPLQVEIRTRAGQPVFRREVSGRPGYAIEVPAGDYDVTITHADGSVTRKTVQVSAAGADLVLP